MLDAGWMLVVGVDGWSLTCWLVLVTSWWLFGCTDWLSFYFKL